VSSFNPGRLASALLVSGLIMSGAAMPWSGTPSAVAFKVELKEEGEAPLELKALGKADRFEILNRPKGGQLIGNPPNLTYRPDKDFFGQDRFLYRALNGEKSSLPAEVTLWVEGVNDLPQPQAAMVLVDKNHETELELKAIDPDGDSLQFSLVQGPSHGQLEGEPPFLTYRPEPGYLGEDRLLFTAEDALGRGEEVAVLLQVEKPNLTPEAVAALYRVTKGGTQKIELKGKDPEGAALEFEITQMPTRGTLTHEKGLWTYNPEADFSGLDQVHFRVFDGRHWSEPAAIGLQVEDEAKRAALIASLKGIIKKGGVGVGNQRDPELIIGDQSYTPASVLKLATAVTALETLGADHHFETKVYLDSRRNLIIKGYGDPGFKAHDWVKMGQQLAKLGVFKKPINHLMLDLSAYEQRPDFDGRDISLEPYDAPIGPLMTNENLVSVRISASGEVSNQTPETPLTSSVIRKAKSLPKGVQTFNLANTHKEGAYYSLEVAQYVFTKAGMQLDGKARLGEASARLTPILIYKGETKLLEEVERMLHVSSNYIANQLVMALSLKLFGEPARMDLGVYMIEDFLEKRVGLTPGSFVVTEGSGLSRSNRVQLTAMLKLVNYFEPYKYLLPSLEESHFSDLNMASLGVEVLGKTGTLTGVSNLVGYIRTPLGSYKPFVILLNGEKQDRSKVLSLLVEAYGTANSPRSAPVALAP